MWKKCTHCFVIFTSFIYFLCMMCQGFCRKCIENTKNMRSHMWYFFVFFLCFTHSLTDARVFWYVSLFDLIFCFVVAFNVYYKISLHLYLDKVVQSRQIYVKKSQVSLLFWLKFEFLFGAYFFFQFESNMSPTFMVLRLHLRHVSVKLSSVAPHF